MNPGSLQHRVNFYKTLTTVDKDGFKNKSFQKFLTTKCSIKQLTYTDKNRSGSKNMDSGSNQIYCTVRYNKNIDETCEVEIYGKKYRIKTITNVNYQNRILEMVLQDG